MERYFPDDSVAIISEPGRYFVESAFSLATNIHTTKTVVKRADNAQNHLTKIYYANQSVFQALLPIAFGEIKVPRVLFNKSTYIYPSIIWGATLDVCDQLTETIDLPELKSGDWIYFDNVGAYTVCVACEFNSFPVASVHSIIKSDDR